MPLNEAAGFRRSNLTKEQKREAEAAIYGLSTKNSMLHTALSAEEIERMRDIVAMHDADSDKGMKEFDLNNPPKKPYTHQDYPCVMYHHTKRQMRKAHSEEEAQLAIDAGWSREPFPPVVEEPELDPEAAAEVAALDREARRPRKVGK